MSLGERGSILATLFEPTVSIAFCDPAQPREALFAEEAALVSDASEQRRREFLNGRACAHTALKSLVSHEMLLFIVRYR